PTDKRNCPTWGHEASKAAGDNQASYHRPPFILCPFMPLPILYSFRRCPYAIRARLALAHAGIACELREVNLRAKPAALLQASAKGTVPVLVTEEGVLEQSLEIMLWALRRNDPDGWLAPTAGNEAQMLALVND